MGVREFPLALVVRAVDKATGPLRAMTARIERVTAPIRNLSKDWAKFSEAAGLGKIAGGFKGVGSAFGNVGREAFGLSARLLGLGAAGAFAMFSIVKGAVDAGDNLATMAGRVGTTVNWFASMSHAAAQADVDQESFNGAMDQFNKRLGEAKAGGGPLLAFLNKVSPALAKQVRSTKSTTEAFNLMTDAFAKITDSEKLAALSAATFGKSGLQMGQLLHQGSAAIQEQQYAYMQLAGSQEAFAKNAGELDNAMRETRTAFLGLRSAALGSLFPAFTKLAKGLSDFLVKNRDGIAKWATETGAAIQKWVEGGGLERLGESLKSFAQTGARVLDMIGGLKGAAIAVGAVMAGPLLASVASLVPAIWSLGAALAPVALALWPVAVAAAPFIAAAAGIALAGKAIYDNWAEIGVLFDDLWANMRVGFLTNWAIVEPILTKIAELARVGPTRFALQSLGFGSPAGASGAAAATPPLLGAAAARPGSVSTRAQISVDFNNAPPGTRVTADKNSSQPVDLSTGYSMVTPL